MPMRRVGTFTAGLILVCFGILFITHLIVPAFSYFSIFQFWPIVFVLLGAEMLYANFRREEVTYDTGAIFLVILMAIFAMVMAGADLFIQYLLEQGYLHF